MNRLLLEPVDVLFFRDGRPMDGSLAGHGDTWPLPSTINASLHAALHRADLGEVHFHRPQLSGKVASQARPWKFGSLVTAGPFPVCSNGPQPQWFFPRPLDTIAGEVAFLPLQNQSGTSNLPTPLRYPMANRVKASKDSSRAWWSDLAWSDYLKGRPRIDKSSEHFKHSNDLYQSEHSYGIGMDPTSGTAQSGKFYSSHSLRLRPGISLGLLAEAKDKGMNGDDLIPRLFPRNAFDSRKLIVGGQQRVCSVSFEETSAALPLPRGMTSGFKMHEGKQLLKWVLLSPSIWPEIGQHSGGWLPSWVDHSSGDVKLKDGPGKNFAGRHKVPAGKEISAKLVAAIVGKPLVVSGYALGNDADPERKTGDKRTHLAVPSGSVYYFEADSIADAKALAASLNWHGEDLTFTTVKKRRSTLMGEKGLGLGVCGTWEFHHGNVPGHQDT